MVEILENIEEVKDAYHKEWWGAQEIVLSIEDVLALMNGKALAFNDGEYSHTIVLETGIISEEEYLAMLPGEVKV